MFVAPCVSEVFAPENYEVNLERGREPATRNSSDGPMKASKLQLLKLIFVATTSGGVPRAKALSLSKIEELAYAKKENRQRGQTTSTA